MKILYSIKIMKLKSSDLVYVLGLTTGQHVIFFIPNISQNNTKNKKQIL